MEAAARVGVSLVCQPCLFFVVFDGVAEFVLVDEILARVIWGGRYKSF